MLLCSLFALQISSFFHFLFFAPFLVIVYYQKSYPASIGYSILCGLIIDIFTSPLRFGIHALNYSLTTVFLYHQKRNLFSDSLLTMPIMTFFFSSFSTFLQVLLLYVFSKPIALSFSWIISDLIFMPLLDALFSFGFFTLPSLFFKQRVRHNFSSDA